MTLQSAAEQALERLKILHVEAGECSHPHECPVVKAITDLELALVHEQVSNEVMGFSNLNGPLLPETLAAIGRMRCHHTQNDLRGQESAILSPE